MLEQRKSSRLGIVALLFILASCSQAWPAEPSYQTVLDKLDEPRGLWLRADGTLCVAEAGRQAEKQPAESNSGTVIANSGALTCLDPAGQRRRVIENLPYVLYTDNGVSVGPTGVAEMDGSLYLLTGEG